MVHPVGGPRRVVLKASRETLALVATASAATFVLAYAIHSRPPDPPAVAELQPRHDQQVWAGDLADVSAATIKPDQPLTSASLVVPKSALALPSAVAKPTKSRSCDPAVPCAARAQSVAPPARPRAEPQGAESTEPRHQRSLMSRLNPLNHLPDASTIGRPFVYAGDTISGWIKNF